MEKFDFEAGTRSYSKKNAYWLGMAAELAYHKDNEVMSSVGVWGFNEFKFFNVKDTQAFIAGNNDMLLISFRGTENIRDGFTDLDIDLVGGPGGKVHEGFITALSYVWRDVWQYINLQRNGRALWITGHSLGAALATIAVAKLRLEKDEPVNGLYTFGQPRTGDAEFAKNFNHDYERQTFRYVNNNDIVTRVPFRLLKYSHVGTFKYFDENGKQRDEMSWWDKLTDRMKGRIADFLEPGTDGIKDHGMSKYVENLERARRV